MYTRFPLSQHPFSILAKAAILESTSLMHQLDPTTRMKLDHFLLFGPDPALHAPIPQRSLDQTLAELELVQTLALQRELEKEVFGDLRDLLTIDDLPALECDDGALSPTATITTPTTTPTFALPPPSRATPTPHKKRSHSKKRAMSTSDTLTHETTNAMSLKERRQFRRPP